MKFEIISFPQYGKNSFAKKVEDYLKGEFGKLDEADPYVIAKFYAGDRLTAKNLINKWLHQGKLVIANRYVSSSKAHLGANLPENKREKFFKWLNQLEYQKNNLPKEDLTILLIVDPKVGQRNVMEKHHLDLHENDLNHLNNANKIYLDLSKKEKNWEVINCMNKGKMKSKEDIQKDIVKILLEKKLPAE
ncbi:hypothetical protein HYS94_05320 [Candidatus Daviesbacteria bacterium]|nr:hypothetical protein [Candidatus Daviesbacteria bacterium]